MMSLKMPLSAAHRDTLKTAFSIMSQINPQLNQSAIRSDILIYGKRWSLGVILSKKYENVPKFDKVM